MAIRPDPGAIAGRYNGHSSSLSAIAWTNGLFRGMKLPARPSKVVRPLLAIEVTGSAMVERPRSAYS